MLKRTDIDERSCAMTALLVFAMDRVAISILNIFRGGMTQSNRILWLNATALVFNWAIPLVVVYKIERRDAGSLGLVVPKDKRGLYTLYFLLGTALPAIYFGFNRELVVDLLEQVVFIGFAEEFFFRGYMMTRFCAWLGNLRGLLLNALIFSLTHAIFVVGRYGFRYLFFLAQSSLQTLAGGLLLGYIFLKSRNILPGSIFHTSMNLYLPRIFS